LGLLATGADQEAHLGLRLDALGDDIEAEFMGEPDGGAHHGGVPIIDRDPEDKLLGELQPVDRIGSQPWVSGRRRIIPSVRSRIWRLMPLGILKTIEARVISV
jgi:hypothetical protein